MKILFFKLEPWEKEYVEKKIHEARADAELIFSDGILDKNHISGGEDADGLCVFVDSALDKTALERFTKLKFIATRSTGFDHIDLEYCRAKNITVASVPSYGENTVAEYAFALLLALSRKIYEAYDRIKETGSFSFAGLRGFDLRGKTLGVLGTGRIGRHTVKIAKGFDMDVVAYDPHPDEKLAQDVGFVYLPLEELLAKSDIVTIHVPYMQETHHLLNEKTIGLMKKGAYLINTSRGGIVDTDALIKALQSGHLGGAGLDVLEEEGVIKDELVFLVAGHPEEHNLKTVLENHALIDMQNVIITPHNAFNTAEALRRILDTTVENILAFLNSQPINVVK